MVIHDEKGDAIGSPENAWQIIKSAPTAFAGGTANARGDKDGTNASLKIFDVTGDVVVRIFGVCTATLVGAGTLEVGVTGNTAGLIAQVSDATTIAASDVWIDSSVAEVGIAALASIPAASVIVNGLDIYEKTASTDITSGQIYYVCMWRALTQGSKVVAV